MAIEDEHEAVADEDEHQAVTDEDEHQAEADEAEQQTVREQQTAFLQAAEMEMRASIEERTREARRQAADEERLASAEASRTQMEADTLNKLPTIPLRFYDSTRGPAEEEAAAGRREMERLMEASRIADRSTLASKHSLAAELVDFEGGLARKRAVTDSDTTCRYCCQPVSKSDSIWNITGPTTIPSRHAGWFGFGTATRCSFTPTSGGLRPIALLIWCTTGQTTCKMAQQEEACVLERRHAHYISLKLTMLFYAVVYSARSC